MRLRLRALRGASFLLSCLTLLWVAEARAHGVMGKREFTHPFVGEHAPVMNEFVARGRYLDSREDPDGWVAGWEIEKKLTDGTSVFLEGGARFHTLSHEHGMHMHEEMDAEDHAEPRSGFDNLEVGLKHQVYTSEKRETIVSLAAFVEAPTGTERAGAEDHPAVGFHALLARGLGDLPPAVHWLRPLAVQTDTGVELPLGAGSPDTEMVANLALQYDLSVLHERVAIPGWMERFVISAEVNFETPLGGPERAETETFVNAGLTWRSKQVQLGLAFQVPLEGGSGHRFVVLPMVSWFYDETFPRLARTLIR